MLWERGDHPFSYSFHRITELGVKQAPAAEVSMDKRYCQLHHSQFASLRAVMFLFSFKKSCWRLSELVEKREDHKQQDNDGCPWTHSPEIKMLLLLTTLAAMRCITGNPTDFIISLSVSYEFLFYSARLQVFFNFWEWRANRDSPYWEPKFGSLKALTFPEKQQIGIYLIFMSSMTMSIRVSTVHFL